MKRLLALAAVTVLCTTVIRADRPHGADPGQIQWQWGSAPTPQAGVCFYDDIYFRGQYFCVRAGEEMNRVPPGMNDKISSFRVIGNVEVTVFQDVTFDGPSGRFQNDVRDLRREGWSDQISSIRVTDASVPWDHRRSPVWGREAVPAAGACFYRDVDFSGDYFCLPRGASDAMVPPGFNDQISSIRIVAAGGVMIFVDRDFGGNVSRLTSDDSDLRFGGWNDRISSIRVY